MDKLLYAAALLFCPALYAQVQITMPQHVYQPHDLIDVTITNAGSQSVSFCVEFGQWSFKQDEHLETTPTPVYVQAKVRHHWSTLLLGPDIGNARMPVTLGAGASQHYPFSLDDVGSFRLVLDYRIGENKLACKSLHGRRIAKSRIFAVQ